MSFPPGRQPCRSTDSSIDRRPGTRNDPAAIWLLPTAEHRQRLGEVVGRLARRHRVAPFAPHLTLLGGLRGASAGWGAALAAVATVTPPLRLRVEGVAHSSRFFETLYLRLRTTPKLDRLRRRLRSRLAVPEPPRLPRPHLSLLYAELTRDERQALCEQLAAPVEVAFAELALAAPRPGAQDWREVDGWRLVASWPLLGSG